MRLHSSYLALGTLMCVEGEKTERTCCIVLGKAMLHSSASILRM